jgi:hypothetical protein
MNAMPMDAEASVHAERGGLGPAEARRLDTVLEALALHVGRLPGADVQEAVVQLALARQHLGGTPDIQRMPALQAPRLSLVEHRAVGQHLKALSACLGAMVDGLSHCGHQRIAGKLLAANARLTRLRLALETQMEQVYGPHPEVYFRCGTSPVVGLTVLDAASMAIPFAADAAAVARAQPVPPPVAARDSPPSRAEG